MKNKKTEKELGYKIIKPLLSPIFRLWYRPQVLHKEYIPKEGPIILCGNHIHVMDQCSALISTRRVVHYMAKKEYFDEKNAWFFKAVGCIPVNRAIKDTAATERALNVLRNGGAIGIFPEGTRNKTDAFMLPFKFGAVSMAKKTGATLVPFGVTGTYKWRTKNLMLRFGEPFKVGDMDLEEANNKLHDSVESLMRQNYKYFEDLEKKEKKK